ncbi:MAG: hypothetical protein H7222_17790 [Methylotenera sp.]|nr:hypothetical protein [Oligoflexia bacterium]
MKSFKYRILALSAVTLLTACTRQADDRSNTFRGVLKDDVKTLDPANSYDSVSLDVLPMIYETLYQYDYLADTYKVVPLLAADLPRFSADRLTLTIPIKHGVKFQDDPAFKATGGKGRELKAQDFVFAFKRLADPIIQSQGWWIFDGKIKGINEFHDKLTKATAAEQKKVFAEPVEGVRALDDYTLQIKMAQPYPQILYVLAMPFTSPVASEAIEVHGDEKGNLTDHPVGTGPYTLTTWEHGHQITLDRNPTHHAEFFPAGASPDAGKLLPFADRLSFQIIKEAQPAWLGFLQGNTDIAAIPKDNFNNAIDKDGNLTPELKTKNVTLNIEKAVSFYYVGFNVKDATLANRFLRQALSSAVDRAAWIEIFTNNRGRKMVNALPEGILDRASTDKIKYDLNLDRARELLKKAGYEGGKGLPVLNFDMRGADSVSRQMGDFFAQQFARIGVKVNVIYNTFPAYLEKAKVGNLQMSYGGWSMDYPDAENVFQLLYGPNKAPGPNESNYENPEMDKLYKQISVMESGPKRAVLVQKMDDLLQEDCPWGLGYYHAEYKLTQPWLSNYRGKEIILNKFKYFRIDQSIRNQRKK